jgi:hypothetical protein
MCTHTSTKSLYKLEGKNLAIFKDSVLAKVNLRCADNPLFLAEPPEELALILISRTFWEVSWRVLIVKRQMGVLKVVVFHKSLNVFRPANQYQCAEHLCAIICNLFRTDRNISHRKCNSKKLVEPVMVVGFEISLQNVRIEHEGLDIAGWIDEAGLTIVVNPVKKFLICWVAVQP